jgi:hypothetical protein
MADFMLSKHTVEYDQTESSINEMREGIIIRIGIAKFADIVLTNMNKFFLARTFLERWRENQGHQNIPVTSMSRNSPTNCISSLFINANLFFCQVLCQS